MHSFLMAARVQLAHGCSSVGMSWHLDMAPKCCIRKSCWTLSHNVFWMKGSGYRNPLDLNNSMFAGWLTWG